MSDWNETAQVAAECLTAQARMPKVTAEYVEPILVEMALLQRKLLLSDESVERAARALYETDRAEYDGDKPWPPRPHFIEDMYRERARAALTAATGGDDE